MRLTRTELKQIAGHVWTNGICDVILEILQKAIKQVGPRLQDSVEVEFTEEQTETINKVKNEIGLK